MSRITQRLEAVRAAGHTGLIVYLTAGCPDLGTTLEAAQAAAAAGADTIELGIPFSDPMADGPVIQRASSLALANGTTVAGVFRLVQKIRERLDIPLALMTYINPVLRYGPGRFVRDARSDGADGLIVPDLPLEESDALADLCREAGLALVAFIAPTTPAERVAAACRRATGFLYCISSTGVTGERRIDYRQVAPVMTAARQYTSLPVAVGFGIASPQAAREAAGYADAVIVGSACMERLMAAGVDGVGALVRDLRQALDAKG